MSMERRIECLESEIEKASEKTSPVHPGGQPYSCVRRWRTGIAGRRGYRVFLLLLRKRSRNGRVTCGS